VWGLHEERCELFHWFLAQPEGQTRFDEFGGERTPFVTASFTHRRYLSLDCWADGTGAFMHALLSRAYLSVS